MNETQAAYRLYLLSEHWQAIRLQALARDRDRCRRCRRPASEVHHKFYRSTWEETRLDDLESLCWRCHRRAHRVPVPLAVPVKFKPGMYEGKPASAIGAAYGQPLTPKRVKELKRAGKQLPALNLRPSFAE